MLILELLSNPLSSKVDTPPCGFPDEVPIRMHLRVWIESCVVLPVCKSMISLAESGGRLWPQVGPVARLWIWFAELQT
jgi:hypothetical protein